MEALGRGHDLNKLAAFLQPIAPLGPDVISTSMNIGDYIKRVGTSLGIDMDGLIKTPEQIAQAQQQAQLMQLAQQLGPNLIDPGVEEVKAQQPAANR